MKKYLLLAALFVASILTNNIQAQVNDPLNHGVWSNESEEVISKKKKRITMLQHKQRKYNRQNKVLIFRTLVPKKSVSN